VPFLNKGGWKLEFYWGRGFSREINILGGGVELQKGEGWVSYLKRGWGFLVSAPGGGGNL